MLSMTELSAVNIIQARTVIGAVGLFTLAVLLRRGRLGVQRCDWWLVGLYGAITLAVNQVVFTVAVARIPIGVALLLEYLAPVLVALWVRFVQRRQVSGLMWAGLVLVVVGLFVVSQVWLRFDLDGIGVLFGLLAAITLAGRFLLAERGLRTYDPIVLAAWGAGFAAIVLVIVGVIEPFPLHVLTEDAGLGGITLPVLVLVLWIGVGMAAAVLLSAAAQRILPPTSASQISTLEIMAGAVLAYVIIHERLSWYQLIGSLIMLVGVVAAQLALVRRPSCGSDTVKRA